MLVNARVVAAAVHRRLAAHPHQLAVHPRHLLVDATVAAPLQVVAVTAAAMRVLHRAPLAAPVAVHRVRALHPRHPPRAARNAKALPDALVTAAHPHPAAK